MELTGRTSTRMATFAPFLGGTFVNVTQGRQIMTTGPTGYTGILRICRPPLFSEEPGRNSSYRNPGVHSVHDGRASLTSLIRSSTGTLCNRITNHPDTRRRLLGNQPFMTRHFRSAGVRSAPQLPSLAGRPEQAVHVSRERAQAGAIATSRTSTLCCARGESRRSKERERQTASTLFLSGAARVLPYS